MNNNPDYTYLPTIVLFAAFIVLSTAACVFLYLSATIWK